MSDRHPPLHVPQPGQDQFLRMGEEASGFLEDHLRTVLVVLGIFVVCAGIWLVVDRSRENARIDAQATLADIAALYPGSAPSASDSSAQAVIEKYRAFIASDPAGVAPFIAQLNLAQALEQVGDTAAAQVAYQAAMAGPTEFAGVAAMRLGYLSMTGDDLAAAESAFNKVMATYPGMAPQAALELGQLAEMAGAKDLALKRYELVMNAYGAAPQAAEAQARFRMLGGVLPEDAAAMANEIAAQAAGQDAAESTEAAAQ